MSKLIFVDTAALIGLSNKRDNFYAPAQRIRATLQQNQAYFLNHRIQTDHQNDQA